MRVVVLFLFWGRSHRLDFIVEIGPTDVRDIGNPSIAKPKATTHTTMKHESNGIGRSLNSKTSRDPRRQYEPSQDPLHQIIVKGA